MNLEQYLGPGEKKPHITTFKKHRNFGNFTLEGVPVYSGGDLTETFFSFFSSPQGNLTISEIPCTANEIAFISSYLLEVGGIVSAIHNHHVLDNPKIYYIHWQMRGDPEKIAEAVQDLWEYL